MTTQSAPLHAFRRLAAHTGLIALTLSAGAVQAQTSAPSGRSAGAAAYVSQIAPGARIKGGGLDGQEKASPAALPQAPVAVAPAVAGIEKQILRNLLNERKFEAALRQADVLLARAPEDAELHAIRGRALYAGGKNAEALSSFEKALALDGASIEAALGRADAKFRLGRLAEIPADLEEALTRSPNAVQILSVLAQAHIHLGKLDAALDAGERAVAAAPGSPLGWNARGLAHARAGRFEQAVADHARAIEIAPKFGVAYANRGVALLRMGRPDQAEADLVTGARTYNIKFAAVHLQALYASRVFGTAQQQASR